MGTENTDKAQIFKRILREQAQLSFFGVKILDYSVPLSEVNRHPIAI